MTTLNTFQIKQEFRALDDLLNEYDPETGEILNSPEDIKEYIDSLEATRGEKLESIERLKRENAGKVDTITAEIKRLTEYKNQVSKKNDRLIDLQFELTGGNKIETDLYKFSSRKSTSVQILNESIIAPLYLTHKETYTPDKKAIKEALQNGEVVDGAELITKVSLAVK